LLERREGARAGLAPALALEKTLALEKALALQKTVIMIE